MLNNVFNAHFPISLQIERVWSAEADYVQRDLPRVARTRTRSWRHPNVRRHESLQQDPPQGRQRIQIQAQCR